MPRDKISKYWRRIRKCAAKNQKNAEGERDEAAYKHDAEKIAAALNGIEQQSIHANNEDTPAKKGERSRKWWEISGLWAAAAVGVGAIVSGNYDAGKQREVMQGQLIEMKAEQRAWVYADFVPASTLSFDRSGNMKFSINAILKNTGHQPAAYVFPLIYGTPREHIWARQIGELEAQKRVCDPEKSRHLPERISKAEGRSVFPGQEAAVLIPVTIPAKEISEAMKANGSNAFTALIFGCVEYQFISDGSLHQTGFMFRLRRDGPEDEMIGPVISPKEGDIDASKLHLMPFVDGSGFYAY